VWFKARIVLKIEAPIYALESFCDAYKQAGYTLLITFKRNKEPIMLTKKLTDEQVVSAFNDQDEGKAYNKELNGLTKSQQCGDALCTYYGFDIPCGLNWAQTSTPEILELVTGLPWRMAYIDALLDEGGEMEEILQGIEFFRVMNEDASNWVKKILNACASDYAPLEASIGSDDIHEWLDDVTWKIPELVHRRLESPVLFGKICLELERYLNEIQSGQEDSGQTRSN